MRAYYYNYVSYELISILIIRSSSDNPASPSEKEEQVATETEKNSDSVSSWHARAAECGRQSTLEVLKLLLISNCNDFHNWYSSLNHACTLKIVSELEPNGNYEIYQCYAVSHPSQRNVCKTFFRCTNPNAPGCSCIFSYIRGMTRHQNIASHAAGAGNVCCPYCKGIYSRPDSLKRHIDKVCSKEGSEPLKAPSNGGKE